jgi:hypothetical protein
MPTIEERVALIEQRLGIRYPVSDPDGHVEGEATIEPQGPGESGVGTDQPQGPG